VNQGFSGGEKKRNEMVQMAVFRTATAVLDEKTDSGLDIDALRWFDGINRMPPVKSHAGSPITSGCSIMSCRILVPCSVDGRIVRTGGPEPSAR
jgi:Fe-S cluster assembly ATP-binding protein